MQSIIEEIETRESLIGKIIRIAKNSDAQGL